MFDDVVNIIIMNAKIADSSYVEGLIVTYCKKEEGSCLTGTRHQGAPPPFFSKYSTTLSNTASMSVPDEAGKGRGADRAVEVGVQLNLGELLAEHVIFTVFRHFHFIKNQVSHKSHMLLLNNIQTILQHTCRHLQSNFVARLRGT